jgi:hypothetical protein
VGEEVMSMIDIKDLEIVDVHILSAVCESFVISWSANIGFGEVLFYKEDDKWCADTECMSKDFCKLLFDKFLENVEIEK